MNLIITFSNQVDCLLAAVPRPKFYDGRGPKNMLVALVWGGGGGGGWRGTKYYGGSNII